MNSIPLHIEEPPEIALHVEMGEPLSFNMDSGMYAVGPPFFDGPYEVTPSTETQTLRMKDMRASADVIIDPIPSNYGLITYNGTAITVS